MNVSADAPLHLQSVGHPGQTLGRESREDLVRLSRMVASTFLHPILVNIGVHLGASMACLRAGSPQGILMGIDVSFRKRRPPPYLMEYLNAVYLEMDSRDACKILLNTPHLVFVDGGHGYEVAKADMEGWGEKLCRGGIIIIHDLHMGKVQSAFRDWYNPKLWREVEGGLGWAFRKLRA